MERGYAKIHREWKAGDSVTIAMPMPVQRVVSNQKVEADQGKVAFMRGPLVYCFESIDKQKNLDEVVVSNDSAITFEPMPNLLGGVDNAADQSATKTCNR